MCAIPGPGLDSIAPKQGMLYVLVKISNCVSTSLSLGPEIAHGKFQERKKLKRAQQYKIMCKLNDRLKVMQILSLQNGQVAAQSFSLLDSNPGCPQHFSWTWRLSHK